MIDTASKKVQINQIVRSQLPSFVSEDNPLFVDFLSEYYRSQEFQGGPIDIITNLNEYQKSESFSGQNSLVGFTTSVGDTQSYDTTINVVSTAGWPSKYGLLKIRDEIITYTGITTNSFTGCIRGFSGIDNLHSPVNSESLVFAETEASSHPASSKVTNLSNLFLQEFWKKTKNQFLPGFEDRTLTSDLDKANFLRQAKDFYASKGTDEAIKILFAVLFNKNAEVIKPIEYLISPSDADYVVTDDIVAELISGDPKNVIGQTLYQTGVDGTSASIFNAQRYEKNGKSYYLISLSKNSIIGNFNVTGSSILVENVSIGSTVITVDSTIGFGNTGSIYIGVGQTVGIATYTNKSSTQFFGLTGITSSYTNGEFIRGSRTVYAYENGDLTKPVYFRLTSVASGADIGDYLNLQPGDVVKGKQLGDVTAATNYRLNSWIHNIKTKSDVAKAVETNKSIIDTVTNTVTTTTPHLLNLEDSVTLLDLSSAIPANVVGTVSQVINSNQFKISITSGTINVSRTYKVQKNLTFASSNSNQIDVSKFVANVQNTYTSLDDKYFYVTSGSLPSYKIYATDRRKTFGSGDVSSNSITINNHGFYTGDLVTYSPVSVGGSSITGLSTNTIYAVSKGDDNTISLARSPYDAFVKRTITITGAGTTHRLVPTELSNRNLQYQNYLRQFPVNQELKEYDVILKNENVGMFRNGVEIVSNVSGDSIYNGNIVKIEVENGGSGYDVVNRPYIHISDSIGAGATAYAVVENGTFKSIEITYGGYDIRQTPSIRITGGNGSGATASARLRSIRNSKIFNSDSDVNLTDDRIEYPANHLFYNGESVVYYKPNGYAAVGGLVDGSLYYVHKVSDTVLQLMNTYSDALNGLNAINLTSRSAGASRLVSTVSRNILDRVVVENPGSGYSNRKVLVTGTQYPPSTLGDVITSGINTSSNYIYFEKHGFKSGDLVEYSSTGTAIGGISTTQNYYVVKLDDNRFKVAGAGIGTTSTTLDYDKQNTVNITSVGVGTHTFKYPDIHVNIDVVSGYASSTVSYPTVRPVCTGTISNVYITSSGAGYGVTNTFNVHRRPDVTISSGTGAIIDVIVSDGKISEGLVKNGGSGYSTPPILTVVGDGKYAKVVGTISGGKVTSVTVIDAGAGYTQEKTSINVTPVGSGAKFRADVKEWKVDFVQKHKKSFNQNDDGIIVPSQNSDYGNRYVHSYLSRKLRQILNDNIESDFSEKSTLSHSPIVGWAYDGSPIYGPYGYGLPTGGSVKRLAPSYTLTTKSNRPPTSVFPLGFFISDWEYTADGDLDQYNGRFCKTPEFPDGVYAYFCTIEQSDSADVPFVNNREPLFPYVLNGFKFKKNTFNDQPSALQNLSILNSGEVVRNTYPYKFGFTNSEYDYLISNNIKDTELVVRSVKKSGISTVDVVIGGNNYKVGERVVFNNSNSGGSGAAAKVETVVGRGITEISYTEDTVSNISFSYANQLVTGVATASHNLTNNDLVIISGIGTGELKFVEGVRTIAVSSVTARLDVGIGTSGATGITTTLTLETSGSSGNIFVDDTLVVGATSERLKVLSIDRTNNKYRVLRQIGVTTFHNAGQLLTVDQNRFTFTVGVQTNLSIEPNKKIVFDPQNSIGIGTTVVVQSVAGVGTTTVVRVKSNDGTILSDHQLPPSGSTADNTISITNHGLKTGDRLVYKVGVVGVALTVSNNLNLSDSFNLANGQTVFAVKKGENLLGITTTKAGIGSTSTSLYFLPVQDNTGSEHSFTTANEEHIGSLKKYTVNVKTASDHSLNTTDKVTVSLLPSSTLSKSVEYDSTARKTLIDPKYFNTTNVGVGTSLSTITITDHNYSSGDKVLYVSSNPATPLINRGEYFVQKLDDNRFRLSTNYKDSVRYGGQFVGITSFGSGVHKISRINPNIEVIRGQTVGFAVSDTTVSDFKLEFFEDQDFLNRYDGIGISTEVTRSGTPGSSGALVNLKISNDSPSVLYYKLTPTNLDTISVAKRDAKPDASVVNGSKIVVRSSDYSGTYAISTSSATSYKYQVPKKPETSSYTSSGVTTFRYVTNSPTALGPINEIDVSFGGVDYVKTPGISTVRTTNGYGSVLSLHNNDSIGLPSFTEITKIGFDYPSDSSVKPRIDTPSILSISKNYRISSVGVVTTGRNYLSAPDLIVVGKPDANLVANIEGTSVTSVDVLTVVRGLDNVSNPVRIVPIRNSNGVGIVSASSNGDTNFLTLTQPTNGWKADGSDFPFKVGDKIFVEGIGIATALTSTGGYNSEDYDYQFFTVKARTPLSSQITYSITGIGTTGGTFDADNSAGRVISQSDLPTFDIKLQKEEFFNGEKVTYGANGSALVLAENGYDSISNTLRINQTNSNVSVGNVVKGSISGAEATVIGVYSDKKFFETDYRSERPKGWQKDTGKLNNDFQRIEDSNYYQSFSYSIKSEVQETKWNDAVDSIVHPSGYKNFSDLIVSSTPNTGSARSDNLRVSAGAAATSLFVNIDNVKSFYVREDFDYASETTLNNQLSKYITFQNKKITNFINAVSNKVDIIDDISSSFTGIGTTTSASIVGLTSFRLTTDNGLIVPFTKIFDGSSSSVISVGSSVISLNNHNFQNGEKIKYDPGNEVYGNNRVGIETSNKVIGGVSTSFLPAELYVIKIDNNNFSLAGLNTAVTNNEPLTFRAVGTGTSHSFDVVNPDNRVIIDIDGIIQSPLYRKNVSVSLNAAVGVGSTTIEVVGVTSISTNNLLEIDREILRVKTVGFGSTNVLTVDRGLFGSVAAAHTVGAAVTMKGGDFHIIKDVIHFVDPPYGAVGVTTLQPGISTQSSFSGRIFNRQDPNTNFIFDDISDRFTGVGKTFTLLQNGQDVTGIVTTKAGAGGDDEVINNGIILINNVFQRPTIDYTMDERQNPGIGASIFFTGTNREDLPKGGIINEVTVGLGSGYQTLVAAAATAIINGSGSIESVVVTGGGSGYRSSDSVSIQVLNPLGIGSTAVLTATVGSAGTITGITTTSGGSGYASTNPPVIVVGIPTAYSNITFTGGQGSGLEATIIVGAGGSVIDFNITDRGIGYANGDVLTVAGIPTDPNVGAGFSAITFTIDSIISDEFSGYSFGQLIALDDFSSEFDGFKQVFTLSRTITTKEIINIGSDDTSIKPANNLIVVLNGVLQTPGQNYIFNGGTQIEFTEPPKAGSKLQILYFRGSNTDVNSGNPFKTVKTGDKLTLQRNGNFVKQGSRTVTGITGVSQVETNLYGGAGINTDPNFRRMVSWEKQTKDLILNNEELAKSRDSLIAKVEPSTNIIQNVGINSNVIYVKNAFPFFSAYDNRSDRNTVPGTGIKIIRENNVERARATITVSAGGTVSSVSITDGGIGYETVPTVSFSSTITQIQEIGKTWTQSTSNTDIEYNDVTYAAGLFVAVGSTSGVNTSKDGVTWYDSGVSGFGTFFDVFSNADKIIAVGLGGTVAISTDGSTFDPSRIYRRTRMEFVTTYEDEAITQDLFSVTVGTNKGVAVGAGGTILFSQNGPSGFGTSFIVADKFSSQNLRSVANNGTTFIIVGDSGTLLRSTDGETWSGVTTTSVTTRLNDVYYADNKWIAVGAAGTVIRSTDDGLNWSVVSSGSTFSLNSVYYQNEVWVAIGQTGNVLNSIDTDNWYQRSVGISEDYNGLAFGDNKLVAVGLSSSIVYSSFETVSAAGTVTISAGGTVTGVTISDGGFGYNSTYSVDALISVEPVTSELITSVDCDGDFGIVVGVGTSATGIGTDSPMVTFELDSDPFLENAGFGVINKSGIQTGDYFVVHGSVVGNGLTSINVDSSVIGIGTTFIDNVYKADQVVSSSSGIVTVHSNVQSLAGLGETSLPRIGYYSWGKFYNFTRDVLNPKSFTINNQDGYTGLSTAPIVVRINGLNENYSDFDQTT